MEGKTSAFILAGGLGTRLAHIVKDQPKPMASIGGRPFLEYQILWLKRQGIVSIVLLVGYKKEAIIDYFGDGSRFGVSIRYSVEEELLGTGGAFLQALHQYPSEYFLLLNGDTFFDIDLRWLIRSTAAEGNGCTIALKYKEDVKRYGYVVIDASYRVMEIREKNQELEDGYINGGIYCGKGEAFLHFPVTRCSMETELFPQLIEADVMKAVPFGDRFIDIGIAEDYYYADRELDRWFHSQKTKALFLDRDGVLVEDTGYLHAVEQLKFIDQMAALIHKANQSGYKVFVVTNQSGVARGMFGLEAVDLVNAAVRDHFRQLGAVIDDFFVCPFHEEGSVAAFRKRSLLRKPDPAMILLACEQYGLDLHHSHMVGDKDSDCIRLPYLATSLLQGRYEIKNRACVASMGEIGELLQ